MDHSIKIEVFVFTVLTGVSNTALFPYFNLTNPSVTRSHNLRIVPPILHFQSSQQNIISRSCHIWNILPDSILSSQSKIQFRKKITQFCVDPYRNASDWCSTLLSIKCLTFQMIYLLTITVIALIILFLCRW